MPRAPLTADALVRAYELHGRSLSVIAAAWAGPGDAADLLQEAARVAWESRDRLAAGDKLLPWLAQIVRNVGSNWRRARRPIPDGRPDQASNPVVPSAPLRGPYDAELLGLSDELARALAELGDMARDCLLLRVVTEHSFAEIAEILDIPENTAQSHVRRARAVLRRALATPTEPPAMPLSRTETR